MLGSLLERSVLRTLNKMLRFLVNGITARSVRWPHGSPAELAITLSATYFPGKTFDERSR